MILPRNGSAIPKDILINPATANWSIQGHVISITVSLTTCALVTVLCRAYVRIFMLRRFGIDDYLIVTAMIIGLVTLGFLLKSVSLGLGRHYYAIPPQNISSIIHIAYNHGILVPFAIYLVKLSIAVFLLRVTKGTRYRYILLPFIGLLVVFTLLSCFSLMFLCVPIHAVWEFWLRPPPLGTGSAKCMSWNMTRDLAVFNSITNIGTDVVLAVLPIQLIWGLQVNKRTKISLILILSLGFFACGAAIVRTVVQTKFFHNEKDPDMTGPRSWLFVWQSTELNVGIIAATLPVLKPLFKSFLKTAKAFTTSVSQSHSRRIYNHNSSLKYVAQKDESIVQLAELHDQESEGSTKYPRSVATREGESETTLGMSRPEGNESNDRILGFEDAKQGIVLSKLPSSH